MATWQSLVVACVVLRPCGGTHTHAQIRRVDRVHPSSVANTHKKKQQPFSGTRPTRHPRLGPPWASFAKDLTSNVVRASRFRGRSTENFCRVSFGIPFTIHLPPRSGSSFRRGGPVRTSWLSCNSDGWEVECEESFSNGFAPCQSSFP
ncbi:hypothetical protein BC567DRAFT_227996 [Phyllosticta citribraziliensis]